MSEVEGAEQSKEQPQHGAEAQDTALEASDAGLGLEQPLRERCVGGSDRVEGDDLAGSTAKPGSGRVAVDAEADGEVEATGFADEVAEAVVVGPAHGGPAIGAREDGDQVTNGWVGIQARVPGLRGARRRKQARRGVGSWSDQEPIAPRLR
ncbi:MAG: hypothetical protein JW751_09880 [Polyangiaceae bacterium]|nr:hypothetical protein [Polyangiaceae bacterium]